MGLLYIMTNTKICKSLVLALSHHFISSLLRFMFIIYELVFLGGGFNGLIGRALGLLDGDGYPCYSNNGFVRRQLAVVGRMAALRCGDNLLMEIPHIGINCTSLVVSTYLYRDYARRRDWE